MAPDQTRITLNGFRVAVHADRFPAFVKEMPDTCRQCLRAILDGWYNAFEIERQRLEGEPLGDPGIDGMLDQMS